MRSQEARQWLCATHNSVTAVESNSSVSLAEWEMMTPALQAAYKDVIDLPCPK